MIAKKSYKSYTMKLFKANEDNPWFSENFTEISLLPHIREYCSTRYFPLVFLSVNVSLRPALSLQNKV